MRKNERQVILDNAFRKMGEKEIEKNLKHRHDYDEDVLLFFASSLTEAGMISHHISTSLTTYISALEKNMKIHIISIEGREKVKKFLTNFFLSYDGGKYFDNVAFSEIRQIEIDEIGINPVRRAGLFGNPNLFPFAFFHSILNDYYNHTTFCHNDIIFLKDKWDFVNQFSEFDICTNFGPICFSNYDVENNSFEKLRNMEIGKWFDYDKKKFLEEHIHSGIIYISPNFKKKFAQFIKMNLNNIINEQNDYKFLEQEITTMFLYSNKHEFKTLNMRGDIEGKATKAIRQNAKFIHYDVAGKGLFYLNIYSREEIQNIDGFRLLEEYNIKLLETFKNC